MKNLIFTKTNDELGSGYNKKETINIQSEQQLIDHLKNMHDDFRQKEEEAKKEAAESALPEAPDYEHKTYEGKSEQEIKDDVNYIYNQKLESETEELKQDAKSDTDEIVQKQNQEYYDYEKKKQDIENSLKQTQKENDQKMLENGLSRSSIQQMANDSAEKQAQSLIGQAKADADSVVAKYQSQIDNLNKQLETAINDLNAEYVIKISTEIEDLIAQRDKEIKDIQEYNNKIDKQIADYKLKREELIQEDLIKQMEADQMQQSYESQYGYVGEKADNYKERLNIALDFYKKFDTDTAKQMILNNHYLEAYLGYEYNNLIANIAIGK